MKFSPILPAQQPCEVGIVTVVQMKTLSYRFHPCPRSHGWTREDLDVNMDFPGGSDGKASVYNAGDLGSTPGFDPWVGKILSRRKWQPTPVLLPRKSHRWRTLVSMGSQTVGHD